jgi:hypothetical protein
MDVVPVELFGVSVDMPLPVPVSMRETALEDFVRDLCDPQKGVGVRPSQCQLIGRDLLYQYELNATFFEGNGTLVRTAERARIAVRNARNWADWQLVQQTLCRVHALIELDPKSVSNLSMQAQVRFVSLSERERFLRSFAPNRVVARPGALGHVRIPDGNTKFGFKLRTAMSCLPESTSAPTPSTATIRTGRVSLGQSPPCSPPPPTPLA